MADRILLLPDNIANQIAAGEVIQRPASAVKELLENAVDAGATEIKLFIQDAGKALIQVVDNGSGMSETDARMAFERHATSKIQSIDDLFHIRTMGFRGEALASIAAVAQVELRTKRADDEVGTCLDIENSQVVKQSPVATPAGTSIAMKNLFFNVPARRNFLKSNAAEMRHIIDEFIRVAMAFPQVFFSAHNNGQMLFHLDAGSLKQRIVQLLGSTYNNKLVAVKEATDYLTVQGFVGKPETAKKTRGDQYFFVNNRFIRSAYLNHAVQNAFQELIPGDAFPMYVLAIELDPTQVDVNVHPTKQEIKFEDEKIVYAFVQAAVKHALAQFSITPALDFELDASIQSLQSIQQPFTEEAKSAASGSALFQTFTSGGQAHKIDAVRSTTFSSLAQFNQQQQNQTPSFIDNAVVPEPGFSSLLAMAQRDNNLPIQTSSPVESGGRLQQLWGTYILVPLAQSFRLVHQQAAHERILYERLQQAVEGKPIPTQQALFPTAIELSAQDAVLLTELLPQLARMGYAIEPFGKTTFALQGTPADISTGNERIVLEKILEQYKHFNTELKLSPREVLLRSVAAQQAIKAGTTLTETEMQQLVADLASCTLPNATPSGRPTYTDIKKEFLDKQFGR